MPAASLFLEKPEAFWVFQRKRYPHARVNLIRSINLWRLRHALLQAKSRSQTPILSAEVFCNFTAGELSGVRAFLNQQGFDVRVIAYLRPIKSLAESLFQQHTKWFAGPIDLIAWLQAFASDPRRLRSAKFDQLSAIFGRENLIIRPFVRSELADGCVVRDFCRVAGLTLDSDSVIRANDSLSVDAVRFLYTDACYGLRENRSSFPRQLLLINRLTELQGKPLRFHSKLFAPYAAAIAEEEAALRDRYGIDISEDLSAHDNASCIRHPDDLICYSRKPLDWLAQASGGMPIQESERGEAALAVASQIERIRRRPSFPSLAQLVQKRIRSELRRLSHGV